MSLAPESVDLSFHHPDLAPLKLWTAEPSAVRGSASTPIVLIVPALGTPAGVYRRLAEGLALSGLHAAVLELRGVAESPVRASSRYDFGYADLIDGDLDGALRLLQRRYAGQAPIVCGHSLGGQLALLHQARHPHRPIAGIVLMASGAPYARAYPGWSGWATRGLGWFARTSTRLLGYFPGHWLGFGGRQGATLMSEWGEFVRSGQPQVRGWLDDPRWRVRLSQLRLPVLALNMPADAYAPPASMRHLVSLTAAQAELVELTAQQVTPGHFAFLKSPVAVVEHTLCFARRLQSRDLGVGAEAALP